jgi:hypothetical protein
MKQQELSRSEKVLGQKATGKGNQRIELGRASVTLSQLIKVTWIV